MNQSVVDMLEPLRQPDPISWWPPAPGWWLVALALLALLAWGVYRLLRFYQRGAPLREARARVTELVDAGLKPEELAAELNRLQRRVAMALGGRDASAGLVGNGWANYLNGLATDDRVHFDEELLSIAHRPQVSDAAARDLLAATRGWLEQLGRPR